MICIIALIVFGVMGIFSASHRQLAKESFDCVFRRVTLRKCRPGMDKKLKSKLTGLFMKRSPGTARFVYKNFEIFSWTFTVILVASMVYSGIGIYNLSAYGSCDPHSTECIFNPGELTCGSEKCAEKGCACEDVGCEAPVFKACEGVCECQETLCG